MMKNQTTDDVITVIWIASIFVLIHADQNTDGMDIRERNIWRMTNDIRKSA